MTMLTVTTAATGTPTGTEYNLITVEVARTAMDIVDQYDDPALLGFITRASDVIARHCRRVFARETVSEQFRLDRLQEELILARYPVAEIVSIVENGTTLAADTDYEVDADKGLVRRLYNDRLAWWPRCKVTVAYTAGFELPAGVPSALQQACVQLVKSYAMGTDRDPMISSEASDNISSASYFRGADHLPPEVSGLLKPFRKIK